MITKKQLALLTFIDAELKKSPVSPSYQEMMEALGLKSKSGVHRLIKSLEERGCIKRIPEYARSLTVLISPASFLRRQNNVVKLGMVPDLEDVRRENALLRKQIAELEIALRRATAKRKTLHIAEQKQVDETGE